MEDGKTVSTAETYAYAEVDGKGEEYRKITYTLESFFVGCGNPGIYYLLNTTTPQIQSMVLIAENKKEYILIKASLRDVEVAKNKIWLEGNDGIMEGFLLRKRKR